MAFLNLSEMAIAMLLYQKDEGGGANEREAEGDRRYEDLYVRVEAWLPLWVEVSAVSFYPVFVSGKCAFVEKKIKTKENQICLFIYALIWRL